MSWLDIPSVADSTELAVNAAVELAIVYKLTAHSSVLANLVANAALVPCRPVPVAPGSLVIGFVELVLVLSPEAMGVETVDVLMLPFDDSSVVARSKLYTLLANTI